MVKKILSIFVLSCFAFGALLPVFADEELSFKSYQRVKNVTAHDDPLGAIYTMGKPGDISKHLIFIYNQDNYERTFKIKIDLPHYLYLMPNTTYKYTDEWKKTENMSDNFEVTLSPFQSVYYRYATQIAADFPNENSILTVYVEVTNDKDEKIVSTNKIYIPNFQPTAAVKQQYENLNKETKERELKLLKEEQKFIEEKFLEMLEQQSVLQLDENNEFIVKSALDDSESEDLVDNHYWFWLAFAGVLIILGRFTYKNYF